MTGMESLSDRRTTTLKDMPTMVVSISKLNKGSQAQLQLLKEIFLI